MKLDTNLCGILEHIMDCFVSYQSFPNKLVNRN
jgi:hypothetical protein